MKAMNELFEDELRRRLKAYTEEPAPRLWESVAAQIETSKATQRKRPWVLWITLGLVIPAGLYLSTREGTSTHSSVSESGLDEALNPAKEHVLQENTISIIPEKSTSIVSETPQQKQHQQPLSQLSTPVRTTEPTASNNNGVSAADNTIAQIATGGIARNDLSADSTSTLTESATEEEPKSIIAIPKEVKESDTPEQSQPDGDKQEQQKKPLNLYFTIMPTMAYNRIEPNANDNLIIESIDKLAAFSTERLGVRAELGVEQPIGQRFKIFGGLVYFQRDQTIGYTQKVVEGNETTQGPNGEIIITPEFNYVHRSFDHNVRNLGIQMGINYQIRNAKFLHTAGTGIEFHRALNKARPEPAESMANPKAYVFYNLYYRLQYPAQTRLRGVLQPTLNYSFYINESLNAPFYIKPYGLGLNIGVTYNFLSGYR
jgi:hypothetical protein